MARNSQVQRQWRMWRLLCASPRALGCVEIAHELRGEGVTARTVRRDLEALRAIGVPIRVQRDGREVRYSARGDGPELRLDRDALLALRLALGLLRPFEGTPVGEALAQLTVQLEAKLPAAVLAHFAGLVENVSVRLDAPSELSGAEEAFARVREALAGGRVVELDYRDVDGRASSRRVHPQRLILGALGLYLVAYDEARDGALRTFRLERVLAARITQQPARRDGAFDPDEYFAGSLGIHSPEHPPCTYRLKVHTERAARTLRENPWHPRQRLTRTRKGTWELCLELTSARELLPRVLALGPEVELVEPPEARIALAEQLAAALARYLPDAKGNGVPSATNSRPRRT